jgi:hypothetical protein
MAKAGAFAAWQTSHPETLEHFSYCCRVGFSYPTLEQNQGPCVLFNSCEVAAP